jgi:hypothetical protein
MADVIRPVDDSLLKLNLLYTQQEQGMIAYDVLAPSMGRFGRLGFNLANSNYYVRDINDKTQNLDLDQYALVWRTEENLLSLKHDVFHRALGFGTTLRLGQIVYDKLDGVNKKTSQFGFFEIDALFQLVSSRKTSDPNRWFKGTNLGVGSGFRLNFISDQTFIGTTEVNRIRVFPTIQVTASLF